LRAIDLDAWLLVHWVHWGLAQVPQIVAVYDLDAISLSGDERMVSRIQSATILAGANDNLGFSFALKHE
jgi:phosphatidylethanolamine-binding protein (PEBP) family uncharacterized protein